MGMESHLIELRNWLEVSVSLQISVSTEIWWKSISKCVQCLSLCLGTWSTHVANANWLHYWKRKWENWSSKQPCLTRKENEECIQYISVVLLQGFPRTKLCLNLMFCCRGPCRALVFFGNPEQWKVAYKLLSFKSPVVRCLCDFNVNTQLPRRN